jgi:tyrosyl-tRNA synthetase
MHILQELMWRGMVKDVSSAALLEKLLSQRTTIYCGFDPSASSMHLGNFVAISVLMRLQRAGHRVIAVVGGATGMIGDPSGKSKERQLLDSDVLQANTESIRKQLTRFLDLSSPEKGVVVNNFDWLGKLSMIDYLRDYGKYFPINVMLHKDVVAQRLEEGISYTEFSYMVLQAADFLHLYNQEQCTIQFGGSDQWGNLTSGLEFIRKVKGHQAEAAVFTTPLITRADGKKFGKSEDGALFLDAALTSPYQLYQYFYNVSDIDAVNYLKVFSFLPPADIDALISQHQQSPGQRLGQKRLAEEVVTLIHGQQALQDAVNMSEVLFSGQFQTLSESQLLMILGSLQVDVKTPLALEDMLVTIRAASSKREAKEFIQGNSISVNGNIINQLGFIVSPVQALFGRYTVIRRGKKQYFLVRHI